MILEILSFLRGKGVRHEGIFESTMILNVFYHKDYHYGILFRGGDLNGL